MTRKKAETEQPVDRSFWWQLAEVRKQLGGVTLPLFRLSGDFAAFDADAETLAELVGAQLWTIEDNLGEPRKMATIDADRYTLYRTVERLLECGATLAICEPTTSAMTSELVVKLSGARIRAGYRSGYR